MESMVYRGGQSFKGLFSYLGDVKMQNGGRIITNCNSKGDWKKVFNTSTYGEVYVLKQTLTETIKDSASSIDYDTDWPKSWKGQKYVNFKLAYEGQFYFLMKHTDKEKAKEYKESKDGFEVFFGNFKYDKRHTIKGDQDEIQVKNGGSIVQKLAGTWNNNNRHGEFRSKLQSNNQKQGKIKIVIPFYYFNDIAVSIDRKPTKFFQPAKDFIDQFDIGISQNGVNSLREGLCLFTEILDLFFKHLNFSFEKYQNKSKNMKAYTVFIFEKIVPSGKVSQQRKKKVSINYQALKSMNKVYKLTSSVFEVNPLILFPLNRDKSHFALGAIYSSITKNNDIVESVKFDLIYLDSLYNTQQCVPEILRQYIRQQIQQNMTLTPDQKKLFVTAAADAQADFRGSSFSRQQNEVDCGVFTCIYGFLLTVQFCLQKKYNIHWKWDNREKKDQNDDNLVKWMRKFIKEDAYVGVHNYFPVLLKQFTKKNIIVPRVYKNEQISLL